MPDCLKRPVAEPTVSYHADEEEVQLRAFPESLYQDHGPDEPVPLPPGYSTLHRTHLPSHGKLQRHLSNLSM